MVGNTLKLKPASFAELGKNRNFPKLYNIHIDNYYSKIDNDLTIIVIMPIMQHCIT